MARPAARVKSEDFREAADGPPPWGLTTPCVRTPSSAAAARARTQIAAKARVKLNAAPPSSAERAFAHSPRRRRLQDARVEILDPLAIANRQIVRRGVLEDLARVLGKVPPALDGLSSAVLPRR